jgi:prophage tail gpP-like protein
METSWRESSTVEGTATVYGWLTKGKTGELWREGSWVNVSSPMANVKGKLWIKNVTFTQDDSGGTRTTLGLRRTPSQGEISLQEGNARYSDPNVVSQAQDE